MNRKIAPWFLITLYDAAGCELITGEVQGLMIARTEMSRMIKDPTHSDAVRATIEQLVGNDSSVLIDDVSKPVASAGAQS